MLNAILFNDTSYESHHGSQLVVRQIYHLAKKSGIRIVYAVPMRHDWRRDARLKAKIVKADLCIINGEGTIHDDNKATVVLMELGPFCHASGVKCFLINSVWQRNIETISLAKHFTAIYLRDQFSYDTLASQGVHSTVVPDLSLSIECPLPAQTERHGFLVDGSVFPDLEIQAWQAYNATKSVNDEKISYISISAYPVLQTGKGAWRFFWSSLNKQRRSGLEFLMSRFKKFPEKLQSQDQIASLNWKYAILDYRKFMKKLAASQGVITGRFHCAALCLLSETPTFSISSNTHKIESLFEEAGLSPKRIFSSYEEAILQRQSISFSPEEIKSLRFFMSNCKNRATAMFDEIV
ncbi:MAG: polysaccharide pyruvyl transferase family protein, partial [Zoogloeaceae bacterium]|nr:polysaccharide pyruvyl transferase family protein [Zoogloeaceae bacterium]